MFRWYRDARMCITYLTDVIKGYSNETPEFSIAHPTQEQSESEKPGYPGQAAPPVVFQSIHGSGASEWFFRGWTLQELLAPQDMVFYDTDWTYLGTKTSLAKEIESVTGINAVYLTGARHFSEACTATKMSWLAGRVTTRIEDMSYSMLGIFNLTMQPIYGEGERAFMRLQQELLATSADESLFAWKMPPSGVRGKYNIAQGRETTWNADEWGLLAASPDWFKGCGNVTIEGGPYLSRPPQTFKISRQSVQIPAMPLMSQSKWKRRSCLSNFLWLGAIPMTYYLAHLAKEEAVQGRHFPLNCWVKDDGTGRAAAVSIWLSVLPETVSSKGNGRTASAAFKFKRIRCSELPLSYRAKWEGAQADAVVLQPEIRFGH